MIRRFLSRFMAGRYGFDKLNFALTLLGFILSLVLSLVRTFCYGLIYRSQAAYTVFFILQYCTYIPYAIALFRALSRNIEKRRKEEAAFMGVAGNWISFFQKKMTQRRDVYHKYYNCPTCHRTLRVPKGRGKIKIDCPHCGRQFTKRT